MNKTTRAFLGALIFALLAVLILPAIFGEPPTFDDRRGGDPWRNFVYDFQTLITGVLAVGAAVATIQQMRASDALQVRLHQQLRYDAIKGKLLAVGNLLEFLPSAIRSETFTLRAYEEYETGENPLSNVVEWLNVTQAVERLHEVFDDVRVTACHDYLPNAILQVLDDCKRETKLISQRERARRRLDRHDLGWAEADDLYLSSILQSMQNLQVDADRLAEEVSEWAIEILTSPVR
ncbi:hypothetical protein [Sinorhizobium meliloti]|uniref:hypothetical protein n=1 Tax=Rhizobium meliloti TaxID=382 RepID=UPI000FDCBCAC|nr:hypothetical protein [Sinorhizobium meliloti]RVK13459.1 hypothetical protein CN164_10210 [Sinorhizobium meliloti]